MVYGENSYGVLAEGKNAHGGADVYIKKLGESQTQISNVDENEIGLQIIEGFIEGSHTYGSAFESSGDYSDPFSCFKDVKNVV